MKEPFNLNYLRIPIPRIRSRRLWDFNGSDYRYVIVALTALFSVSAISGTLVTLTILGPILLVGLWRVSYGRIHKVLREELRDLWFLHVQKGELRGRFFNLNIESIDTEMMRLGVLFDPDKNTDNIVIEGEGSPAAALDLAEQFDHTANIGTAVNHVNAEVPFPIVVSWTQRKRPVDMMPDFAYLMSNVHPDVATFLLDEEADSIPDEGLDRQARVDRRLADNIATVMDVQEATARDVTMSAVLSVRRPKWDTKRLTDRELYRMPVARIARMLVGDLENLGIQGAKELDLTGISKFVRTAWDILHIRDYHDDRADGTIPATDAKLEIDKDGNVLSSLQHWPRGEVRAGRNYLYINGTYHRTILITRLPPDAGPNDFDGLKSVKDGYSAITLLGETMSGERDSWILTRAISIRRAFKDWQNHVYETPEEEEARRAQEEEHRELYRGGNVLQLSNILIVVSDTSLEAVQETQETYEAIFRQMGLKGKVVRGGVRQVRAFLSGVLGVSKL